MANSYPSAFERIQKLVVEHLSVDIEHATANANFIDDLGADSLDLPQIVGAIEEEFGIEIDDETAERVYSIGSAVHVLEMEF